MQWTDPATFQKTLCGSALPAGKPGRCSSKFTCSPSTGTTFHNFRRHLSPLCVHNCRHIGPSSFIMALRAACKGGPDMSIGDKVAQLRRQHDWTLKQLAKLSGVSMSQINAIEHMTRPNPSLTSMARLAKAFEVPLSYFVESSIVTHAASKPYSEKRTAEINSPEGTGDEVASLWATSTPEWAQTLTRLYDPETRQFIASEQSRPYVTFAMELAKQENNVDPFSLLQLIARFMREKKTNYPSS
ncbi:XRE family transcriptional regulator [Alicyclobacillaceae bacterium I2511]|nr:XRE family transcriptional regulator [Alicyclobacillaceae bacterium I2511]